MFWRALFLLLFSHLFVHENPPDDNWPEELQNRLNLIESETPGKLGVYVKHLQSGEWVNHNGDRLWYQASTVKIPVAIAILKMAEEGILSLSDRLILQESDFVDGAGDLLWMEPGTQFSILRLLELMLVRSDSTATDMLIRLIGEDELNRRIRTDMVTEGFEPFTTIIRVRYEAYSEIHPDVNQLSNMDLVELRSVPPGEPRFLALVKNLQVGSEELRVGTIDEAFERYYTRRLNSVTLKAYATLLERLNNGELLSNTYTDLIFSMIEKIETGDHRIKAGLPSGVTFAQKTGTQHERACNVGVLQPRTKQAVVIAACAENFGDITNAEKALRETGEAIIESGLIQLSE